MTQAVCENGHPMQSGETKCSECGGRLKMQWMSETAQTAAPAAPGRAKSTVAGIVTAIAAVVLVVSYLLVNFAGIGNESGPTGAQRDRAELGCTMDPSVNGGIYSDDFRNCVEQRLR